jgi:glutamate N-acetyltransferase/amino-acid N-acetyltransferase
MSVVNTTIEHVAGFRVAGVHAGFKKDGRLDFALVVSDQPCVTAGVFTTNRMQAAPVILDQERLAQNASAIRAVAVNTGCANACTGEEGLSRARQTTQWVGETLGCAPDAVLVLSTGVIGTQLNMNAMRQGIDLAAQSLGHEWFAAAKSIMTTDTRPKLGSVSVTLSNGTRCEIAGISKGAGMIAPNMATMLGVVITDAGLSAEVASRALQAASGKTFNRIVVDGDMSTNDTVLLLANGASGAIISSAADEAAFTEALTALCRKLAQDIVRDGEGVTKFITLHITGVPDEAAAHQIANTIATSPLVKTAFFGGDANWGRIVAAAGRAGVPIPPEHTRLWITAGEVEGTTADSLLLFEKGMPTAFSEQTSTAIFRNASVSIHLDCGMGAGEAIVWTCDLSYDYVKINGDYRS